MVHSVCHLVTGLRQYCRNVPRLQTSVRRPGVSVYYRIAGNFWGRKLLWIGENTIFTVKTLADHSFLLCQKTPCPQILQRKLSQITTKPCNLRKFSPSNVSCYTVYNLPIYIYILGHTQMYTESVMGSEVLSYFAHVSSCVFELVSLLPLLPLEIILCSTVSLY